MAIGELLQLIQAPAQPVQTGDAVRWAQVERSLGTRLPEDYRDLVTLCGSGIFWGLFRLELLNPFSASYPEQLRAWSALLRIRRGLPERQRISYGIFPSQPGWLPWGGTDVGQTFCWVTEGDPDRWPLLLISDRNKSFQQLQMPITSFLAQLLTGRLRPSFMIRDQLPPGLPPSFVPYRSPPSPDAAAWECLSPSRANSPDTALCPWDGKWFPPDGLGRPTGAKVVFGPGTRNDWFSGFNAAGFTVYPSWWNELTEPRKWRRGQLIGWPLRGPASRALYNMVPLTWKAQTALWNLEHGVVAGVLSGARMSYTVRAIYEGANRYPSRVAVECQALSASPRPLELFPISVENG
jgi:hypothetical protein